MLPNFIKNSNFLSSSYSRSSNTVTKKMKSNVNLLRKDYYTQKNKGEPSITNLVSNNVQKDIINEHSLYDLKSRMAEDLIKDNIVHTEENEPNQLSSDSETRVGFSENDILYQHFIDSFKDAFKDEDISNIEWIKDAWNLQKIVTNFRAILRNQYSEIFMPLKVMELLKVRSHVKDITDNYPVWLYEYKRGEDGDFNKKKRAAMSIRSSLGGLAAIIALLLFLYKKYKEYLALDEYLATERKQIEDQLDILISKKEANSEEATKLTKLKIKVQKDIDELSSGFLNSLRNLIDEIKKMLNLIDSTKLESLNDELKEYKNKITVFENDLTEIEREVNNLKDDIPNTTFNTAKEQTFDNIKLFAEDLESTISEISVYDIDTTSVKIQEIYTDLINLKLPDFSIKKK